MESGSKGVRSSVLVTRQAKSKDLTLDLCVRRFTITPLTHPRQGSTLEVHNEHMIWT